MFPKLDPMLAVRARRPFHRPGWVYEEKVDGWRMVAYKDGSRVHLFSRHGVDHTARFRELAAALAKLRPTRVILDGEVAVYDEDLVSQFHLLNEPDPAVLSTPPLFMAFDCLLLERTDLRSQPLHQRRRFLEEVVGDAELVFPVRRFHDDGLKAWEIVKDRGYEGFVAKDDYSLYQAGESRSWVKVKVRQEGQFVVGGIGTARDGRPRLFVGERINGRVVYRGAVELGVGTALIEALLKRCRRRSASPFGHNPSAHGVVWLQPTTRVEVSYGQIRQGGLREPMCRGMAETR